MPSVVEELPAVLRGDNEYLRRAMEEGALMVGWPGAMWPPGIDGWLDLPEPEKTRAIEAETQRVGARHKLVREYAWAIPNDEALDAITELSPIVEIGAGGGYWAMLLRERGADVLALDRYEPGPENTFAKRSWSEVERVVPPAIPAALYLSELTLMLCWPTLDDVWAERALDHYSGSVVIYIGEQEGGCCATPGFFALLERDFEQVREVDIPRWYGLRDSLSIWRRRVLAGT